METTRVSQEELLELLSQEGPPRDELERYFVVREDGAFGVQLALREGVRVEGLPAPEGMFGDAALWIANGLARRARRKRYEASKRDHPRWPRLVSEGDSWFQHPLVHDIIDHLAARFSILGLDAAGDHLSKMFERNEYRVAIESEQPAALLLSGGGNDLMGDIGRYLLAGPLPGNDPARYLNDAFGRKLDDLTAIYDGLFREVQWSHPELLIFCHGYDYALPRDGNEGKWLGGPMRTAQVSAEEWVGLVRAVIDRFNERLEELASSFDRVFYVNLREAVGPDQWYDEIHPDRLGFQQVALRFQNLLQEKIPSPE